MGTKLPGAVAHVMMLANGRRGAFEESRARALCGPLPGISFGTLFREAGMRATWHGWKRDLAACRPQLLYSINTALPAVPFALMWARRAGVPFVLDTGDLVFEMARRSGVEPMWRWPLLWVGERLAWSWSRNIVVRSECFREHLNARGYRHVSVIRDGFHGGPTPSASQVAGLRTSLGLDGVFVVGILGSLVWSPKLRICYGWDLLQALALLDDLPVRGLIIGDGNGKAILEAQARTLGVSHRVTFAGRIPYDDVPAYLRVFDVALSTQTNNLPARVRTTGKLPEYMAAGRFILASSVGEAARILPPSMLLDYDGEVDTRYPERLARRIRTVYEHREMLLEGTALPALAERLCGPEILRGSFRNVVEACLQQRTVTTCHE